MKITSFRIRNFRSITDTGWQSLSPDNITCLIGQNESGKTSVLEALSLFHTGEINEDVLRSDLSMPEVSCRFATAPGLLAGITDHAPKELMKFLKESDTLELKRSWRPDFSSFIEVAGDIGRMIGDRYEERKKVLNEITARISKARDEGAEMADRLKELEVRVREWEENNPDYSGGGLRLFRKRASARAIVESSEDGEEVSIKELKAEIASLKSTLESRNEIKRAIDKWYSQVQELSAVDDKLSNVNLRLEERHQKMTLLLSSREEFSDEDWRGVLNEYKTLNQKRTDVSLSLERQTLIAGFIIDGDGAERAESKADKVMKDYMNEPDSASLGEKYSEYAPAFELFEDFGSLLPNRVDLEDIITGNQHVEGYKAAKNFLTIANLNHTFFQQPSSRILKQKIENVNQLLTNNFQDFWQQSVGRNNKIKIQFELDHYNATYGDKAGKPFLEFWIKDEGERLYPKQRSRGVRWFLSFYLELRASASTGGRPLVLLVDEPGVSLHARAQEDVLRVFEDIKDRIQVIYTTHSPHLVDVNKLHRVLAVQRDDTENHRSTTRIIEPMHLSSASPDTLTPLQSIMGNTAVTEGYSSRRLNLVINDIGSFYVLTSILSLTGNEGKINLIPSTEVDSIPLLCNILLGWGLGFSVLLFSNPEEAKIGEKLKQNMFRTAVTDYDIVIQAGENFINAEDLLSTLDFKRHVLETREGITMPNSSYMKDKELPRNFMLSRFLEKVKEGKLKLKDFDEESVENFNHFTETITVLK